MKKMLALLLTISVVQCGLIFGQFFGGGGTFFAEALAEQLPSNFADMSLDELLNLQAEISEVIAQKRAEPFAEEKVDAAGKTLRDIFPCIDLAKAVRDNIGLTSIDQPIPEGKLEQMTSLNYASYADPKAVDIDSIEGIQYLTGLGSIQFDRWMYPSYSKITSLPEGFYSLPEVWQLILSSTSITEIDPRIGNMTTLIKLYLDKMQIVSLPEELGNLYRLETLSISGSAVSKLPDSFSNLQSLQTLDLSDTQISEFPTCILAMPNLRKLDLSGTQISELPPEIALMSSLRELDISNTRITSLPKEMYSMNLTSFNKDGLDIE